MSRLDVFLSGLMLLSLPLTSPAAQDQPAPGELVIHLLALKMDNQGRVLTQQDILTEVQLKNLDSGKRFKVSVEEGPQVVPLPPGRYCVNWFRTYQNIKLDYCRKGQIGLPTATVFPGLPTNAGRWILGIEYAGSDNRINYRVTHGLDREEVAADVLAKLCRPAAKPPAQLQGTIWCDRDLYNAWSFIEFADDGIFEVPQAASAAPTAKAPSSLDGPPSD